MDVTPQQFREIQSLVRALSGLVLTDDKTYLVRNRLEPVVLARKCATFGDYLQRLQQRNALSWREELVEALVTGETSFHRDGHPFEALRLQILPQLAEMLRVRRDAGYPRPQARFWSAGCSTGQEPYSIAIAIHDFLRSYQAVGLRADQFPILATDVSRSALDLARAGRYPTRDLERGLTSEQRNRYFTPQADGGEAVAELRNQIEFQHLNLIEPFPPLGLFDVIFCRNVLIYLDTAARQRLADQFFQLLANDGLLILGAAESLYGINQHFESQLITGTTVYRKRVGSDLAEREFKS